MASDLTGSTTLLERLQLLASTEKGLTLIGPSGEVVHVARHTLQSQASSITSQATYGDQHAKIAGRATLRYLDVTPVRDETLIYPSSRVTREGGAPQSYTDRASLDEYGSRVLEETGLLYQSDLESFDAACYNVGRYKAERTRFEQIHIDPSMDGGIWWPEVLGRRYGDRITIDRTPQGVGAPVIQDANLEGRDITFTFGTADVVLDAAPADPQVFLWDVGLWDQALWAF